MLLTILGFLKTTFDAVSVFFTWLHDRQLEKLGMAEEKLAQDEQALKDVSISNQVDSVPVVHNPSVLDGLLPPKKN